MKETFNPEDWLPVNESNKKQQVPPSTEDKTLKSKETQDLSSEVDKVIARIEAELTDITSNYSDWVNVGFAFAHEFGEAGRKFFQRISRLYPGFTLDECNKQYDYCLKSPGKGITISTFFYLAKQAGIDVKTNEARQEYNTQNTQDNLEEEKENAPVEIELPTLPDYIFPTLPRFLQQVVARAVTREERDILLLGSLVTISSCLQNVFGIYDVRKVYANLYIFITAAASAGKGRLVLCKRLVNMVHWEKRKLCHEEKIRHEAEMREYNLLKGKDLSMEKPQKPPERLLYIPANSSSTGVFQLLSDNDGRGLIFETEGDTLAQAFKTDYGNYSDGFRKAFHHETINYYRRTDREYVEIQEPCISAMLSGTPRQIQALIPSAEDGLSSRFIYYRMKLKTVWRDVFAGGNDNSLEHHFNELGNEFYSLYTALKEGPEIQFYMTPEQQMEFNQFFTLIQEKYLELQGEEYMATVRRLGLIAFRMAMILSTLRILEIGEISPKMQCSDQDFHSVLEMSRVLVRHASYIFSELPENLKQERPKNKKEMFMEKLPLNFTNKEFIELARSLSINERTAVRYITTFCEKCLVRRDQHGKYTNLTLMNS